MSARGGEIATAEPDAFGVANLSTFLRHSAQRLGSSAGLITHRATFSWRDLDERVDALCHALVRIGLKKGDRVLVQARNGSALIESMFASFRTGAIWVPVNFRQMPDDTALQAITTGAGTMIFETEFTAHAVAAQTAIPSLKLIRVGGEAEAATDYEGLLANHMGDPFSPCDVDYCDPCWLFLTSGTSGQPKAAVLTHGQMAFVVNNHLCDLMPGLRPDRDASLVLAPLSHGAGIHLLAQVAAGVKSVLVPPGRLDPDEVWALVEHWGITNVFTVPTIVKLLTEGSAIDQYNHESLRYVVYAGAPMPRVDQKLALRKLGKVLVQYFGLGEVAGTITVMPAYLHDEDDEASCHIGSCGYPRTGMQVSVQDDSGNLMPQGEQGELCVRGAALFSGYYNNPVASRNVIRNGWFRTGDLGHINSEGFVFITGRASDMFISGGTNIHPAEIEEKIRLHPAVRAVAVVGTPDHLWGEVGEAAVVLKPGADLSDADLRNWLAERLPSYKVPKRLHFWPALPTSAYGKVTKRLVKDEIARRGHAESTLAG